MWRTISQYFPRRSGMGLAEEISASGSTLATTSKTSDPPSEVDFGFQKVPENEKADMVGGVFKSVASRYDLMNDIMSGGMHRLWKDRLVSKINPFEGMRHVDVAGGTGDIAFRVMDRLEKLEGSWPENAGQGRVVVCDISADMVEQGKKRAQQMGGKYASDSLGWVVGDAEELPFEDNSFDIYTIGFGIRNTTHMDKVLQEAYRVLRTGGQFLCLEFSQVDNFLLRNMYDMYSFNVIPVMGRLIAGDTSSYQYLVESIRKFPDQEKFVGMIREAGFKNVNYENLMGGVVAIHSGFKH